VGGLGRRLIGAWRSEILSDAAASRSQVADHGVASDDEVGYRSSERLPSLSPANVGVDGLRDVEFAAAVRNLVGNAPILPIAAEAGQENHTRGEHRNPMCEYAVHSKTPSRRLAW
jgi:hypothetical protein